MQIIESIDSLSLVHTVKEPPPMDERDWYRKKGKKLGSLVWINNGDRELNEPRLSHYQTWEHLDRLRADLSIPKLLFGSNTLLPNITEINAVLEFVSDNVSERSRSSYNAFLAQVCRIDYALNLIVAPTDVKRVIAHYTRFCVPRMLRRTFGNDESVYFANNSRGIRIYDKLAQVCNETQSVEIREQAKGIIRVENFLLNAPSVRQYAARLGFDDTTARTMCSQKSITIAVNELRELLQIDSIDLSEDRTLKIINQETGNLKKAMRLSSFLDAIDCYGENFDQLAEFNYSKSTYDRNLRECQELGLCSSRIIISEKDSNLTQPQENDNE